MNRMSLEQGVTIGPPPPSAHGGTDLGPSKCRRSNAYDSSRFPRNQFRGYHAQEALGNLINTDAYKNAPDGASNTEDQAGDAPDQIGGIERRL